MKKFYLVTNTIKDPEYEVTNSVKKIIESYGGIVRLEKDESISDECECILTLGGDGTLIKAAYEYYHNDIPLLGINLGTLGYLTEIEAKELEELKQGIRTIMFGEPILEERMLVNGCVLDGADSIALNDVVLSRTGDVHIIYFDVYVNGALLHSYQADGIIISTPTGSTSYNLSAGGPIVEPTANLFVVTPICPHELNSRSIVLSGDDCIEMELRFGKQGEILQACVSFDGRENLKIESGDRVRIQNKNNKIKLLRLSHVSFLEVLRKKMKGN